jgi:hypothetical protein
LILSLQDVLWDQLWPSDKDCELLASESVIHWCFLIFYKLWCSGTPGICVVTSSRHVPHKYLKTSIGFWALCYNILVRTTKEPIYNLPTPFKGVLCRTV